MKVRGLAVALAVWALTTCDREQASQPPAIEAVAHEPEEETQPEPVEPEPEPEPEPTEIACEPRPALEPTETWAPDEPPAQRASEQVCAALEARARRALDNLDAPCESVEDCELVRVACPFGCTRVFSKRLDRRRARYEFDRYTQACAVCKDKCPALPTALVCEDGTCKASDEPATAPACR